MKHEKRRTVGVILCVAALLPLGYWLLWSEPPRSAPAHVQKEAVRESPQAARVEVAPRGVAPALATVELPEDQIVIDRVETDKNEVCRGEEVVVTVHARSLDGAEPFLNYGVLGHPDIAGPRFTLKLEENLGYDWMRVYVRGKYGTSEVASVPPVLVKPCAAPVVASISVGRRAAMFDRVWLTASVTVQSEGQREREGQPFEAVEYEWDFGDGTTKKVATAEVEHSYEGRTQLGTHSYFFVTLKARDRGGRVAQASESVRLVNLGFGPLVHEDRVIVFSSIDERANDTETIRLYHGAPFAVTIDRVTVEQVRDGEPGGKHAPSSREYAPAALLGFSELPAGQSLEVRDLSHLRPADSNTHEVVRVSGHARGGKRVTGAFTLVAKKAQVALNDGEASGEAPPTETP